MRNKQIVMDLWARTGDSLVLIETGSPYGFALIREARGWVLESTRREARRVRRLRELQAEALQLGILQLQPHAAHETAAAALPANDAVNQPMPPLVFTAKIPPVTKHFI